jgi:hypothetical protein
MPFPSREGWVATNDLPPPVPSTRPPPASRHTRKNSKVAQILGIAGTPEKARDADPSANLEGLMSPPILPMEVDPFSGGPLGATIVSTVQSAVRVQATHLPAPQRVFRPTPSMPSLSMPTEPHAKQTNVSRSRVASNVDTATQRVPQPPHGAGYTELGTLCSRSQAPPLSVPGQHTSSSQVVNTCRERRQNGHHPAPSAAPNLRKARSSVVLSNTSSLPLHAPKPQRVSERPSAEALHLLVESPRANPSESKGQNGSTKAHAVWPPAPVLRPLRIVMPPRAERDAYQTAAIEAEKMSRKISDERGLVERVRHDRHHEERKQTRDSERHRGRHHRRAETDGTRRHRREAENRALAGYEYPIVPERVVAAW